MVEDILVCVEGSAGTDAATRLAIEIARELAATVVGLAIVDEPDIRAGAAVGIGGASFKHDRDEALMADARKHAAEWLARFAERCAAASVTARTIELVGRPAAKILAEMENHDLTVIGRGANFRHETDESDEATRDAVLHHARRPVLLVPEEAASTAGRPVLIAYDGSAASKRGINSIAQSGMLAGRAVHVATADDNGASAWEMANRAVESLRALDVQATAHNVVSPLPTADALLELRAQLDAGLLVMGAYTRLRISELLRGSVTRALIEKTPVPLYLCH